jgi:P-type Ca2+ transporter type 2C
MAEPQNVRPMPPATHTRPTRFDPASFIGLTAAQVTENRARHGFNELPTPHRRTFLRILGEVIREPMFLLLVACGLLYLLVGDHAEAIMLMGFVFVIIGITLYQEQKTEHALEALKDLSSPRALVIRDGRQERIPGREVVLDDLLILGEGDRIPADALVLDSVNLSIDESLLTGESVPVRKHPALGEPGKPEIGGDDQPYVFSGTLAVSGQGIARVIATGSQTALGAIGRSLESVEPEPTRLALETGRLVKTTAIVGLIMCITLIVIYGSYHHDWLHAFLSGVTLAMAMLPEEFPVVLTVFLALGAWRISRHGVLTRKLSAVETIGAITVLCTDKTGTLTQNRMTVQMLARAEGFCEIGRDPAIPEEFHALLEYGVLAGKLTPVDPMERAILDLAKNKVDDHLHLDWTLIQEYPLLRDMPAMSNVWASPDGASYIIAAKGAPETVADLCHLSSERLDKLTTQIGEMAGKGLRVLGVASTVYPLTELPSGQHDFDFVFHGLIGLADPLRAEVPEAVRQCREAGIRVAMITGDYPGTALHIAVQAGMDTSRRVTVGREMEAMSDTQMDAAVRETGIFARSAPEHKLRIVEALKRQGEIVAMTGDGVNDAPALKSAHIGIAMGDRGADVAREAAALVLTHDDFASMVNAVRSGRRVFDNLRKAIAYIIAVHIPIAGMTLLPVLLLSRELVLLPVHIVFLELIIDPACSIVFEMEPGEPGLMKRRPRTLDEPLFGLSKIGVSILQGISVLAILATLYLIGDYKHRNPDEVRAFVFTTLIVANLALILVNRSWRLGLFSIMRQPNPAMTWLGASVVGFLGLVLSVPVLRTFFHFQTLHLNDLLFCLGAGLFSVIWFEALKWIWRRREFQTV